MASPLLLVNLRQNGQNEQNNQNNQNSQNKREHRGSIFSLNSRITGKSLENTGDSVSIHSGRELITYVFPDFKAVEYFQKEFELSEEFYIAEETTATGFEIYLVDQWIRSRKIGSFISVFTGNHKSVVKVIKFTAVKKPVDEYPARFQEYLNELVLNHATLKRVTPVTDSISDPAGANSPAAETQLDEFLLVTNLTAFPHDLNLIAVTNGDSWPAIRLYMINSNLRMFHCGGRSLYLLAEKVSDACAGRFGQIFRIRNDKVPADFAILELVNLVQTCLFYYDLLDAKNADGLLCQKTDDAIQNWWNLIGLPIFNMKPDTKTGIMSSKTVSAIISLTISVKLRLQMFGGCDVPKDIFDFENFMLSIGQFQKQVGLEKKRKLDLTTLLSLFYYTNTDEQAKQMFSVFGEDTNFADQHDLPSHGLGLSPGGLGITQQQNSGFANASHSGASAYRRSRIHYSKELKKLTNVVKNTVQDRIILKGVDDDGITNALAHKSSHKLRSKIASKLADNLTPTDVETVDIDVFVKKCLLGRTLMRLWMGWPYGIKNSGGKSKDNAYSFSASSSNGQQSQSNSHLLGGLHLRGHFPGHHAKAVDFTFVSFKDSVYNQTLANEASRKTGKRRFVFQNKLQDDKFYAQDNPFEETFESAEETATANGCVNKCPSAMESTASFGLVVYKFDRDCFHVLNRRNSYPFISSGTELGLNSIEYHNNDHLGTLHLHRRGSFSVLETLMMPQSELYSSERSRIDYVNETIDAIAMEGNLVAMAKLASKSLEKQFEKTNYELARLHNICYHMEQRKRSIETEYYKTLEKKMNDLTDNIDRMSFRSRDLAKKITELEINAKNFELKVKKSATKKLQVLKEEIIHNVRFQAVFKEDAEMKQVYVLLSGKDFDASKDMLSKDFWKLQVLVVYIYELIVNLLKFFRFDRSRMNLDRIREQYHKLDPKRKYIEQAYSFLGRNKTCTEDGSDVNNDNDKGDSGKENKEVKKEEEEHTSENRVSCSE